MRCRYALVDTQTREVLSTHTQLYHALVAVNNARERGEPAQVRELQAPAVVGERIHYTHLRRWD